MNLVPADKAIANLSQIKLSTHIAAAMSLAVAARPKEQPPVETFQAFQVICGHVEPELLTLGMAECLQRCRWFPTPAELMDACAAIQQLITQRAFGHRASGYAARNKIESQALDLAEFEKRLLPPTQEYIEQRRKAIKPNIPAIDIQAHHLEMLKRYESFLATATDTRKREYFQAMINRHRQELGQSA